MPLPDEYQELIPEEYKGNKTLDRFNDISDVFKTVVEQQAMLGNTIGRFPGPDVSPENRAKWFEDNRAKLEQHGLMLRPNFDDPDQDVNFWRTLGTPADVSGYEPPDDLPEPLDPQMEAGLQKAFLEANIPKRQYQKVVKQLAGALAESRQQNQEAIEKQNSELKQEWGMAFNERVEAASAMKEQFPGLYPDKKFGDLKPNEIRSLYELAASMTGKGPQVHRQGEQHTPKMTPAEGRMQMDEIMARIYDPESNLTPQEEKRLKDRYQQIAVEVVGMSNKLGDLRVQGAR